MSYIEIEDEEVENANIDADPDFYRGYQSFNFPNGDKYEGEFIAHISGILWREGKGTYTSQDGQIYSGIWFFDELKESKEAEITYPNGSKYVGHIVNNQYAGSAKYSVTENYHILGNFVDNKPEGELCMIDYKGREWRAEGNDYEALLLPEHTYFNDISSRLGKGALRVQKARVTIEVSTQKLTKIPQMDHEALSKLEMKIFAKTKKTLSNLKFESSQWYTNWVNFRKVFNNIQYMLDSYGYDNLRPDEKAWLTKYNRFKKNYLKIMEAMHEPKYTDLKDCKLYELFMSETYLPAVPIFVPQVEDDESRSKEVQLLTRTTALRGK